MEKLFLCGGRVAGKGGTPEPHAQRLAAESDHHAQATPSRSLEQNSKHFHEAREKLERWADDMVLSAEKTLGDTKEQIKALRRQARQAVTLEKRRQIQAKTAKLESQQRRQRIYTVEDEIMEKRDQLERRLAQRTATVTAADFRGLRKLKAACGTRFAAGVVLYDGETTVGFGDGMHAVPIRALWEKN